MDSTTWHGTLRLPEPTEHLLTSYNYDKGEATMALTRKQVDSDAKAAKAAQPAQLDANSTAKERADANRAHHQEMAGHLIEDSVRAKHGGHMLGRQGGEKGHEFPPSDADRQSGAYIPRGAFAKVPQNTYSDGAASASANDASTADYGTVDKG
jgi:hypothetical protein